MSTVQNPSRAPALAGAPTGRNLLLAALPTADQAALRPHLERVTLATGDVLAATGEPFSHVYFPETCVISLIKRMTTGGAVEAGTIGHEGFAGISVLLDASASAIETVVQIAGTSLRLPALALAEAADARPELRRRLHRYVYAYLAQVSQTAACNRLHTLEERCARWLLMTHDRVDKAESFALTHEFLAIMLGVRRAGVTVAAGALQAAGLISYRRGHIHVLDRKGLEAAACECYAEVRWHFERLAIE